MEIPEFANGVLHLDEGTTIDLGLCSFDNVIELLGAPELMLVDVEESTMLTVFPHIYGKLVLLWDVCCCSCCGKSKLDVFHDQQEYFFEDLQTDKELAPILIEIHLEYDMEITLAALEDKYGPARFFRKEPYDYAVFSLSVIARMIDKETVESLWFLCEDFVLRASVDFLEVGNPSNGLYSAIVKVLYNRS